MEGAVRRLDSKQLAQVDIGTWFNRAHPEFARGEFAEETVPTLAQVFELCRNRQATIYVEMKTDKGDAATELAHALANLVKAFNFNDRVVVVSFDLAAIATLKTLDNSIRTGALFGSSGIGGRNWRENMIAAAADCGADELLLHRLLARRKLVEKAHEIGLPLVVWTVDDAGWVERAGRFGLHAVITNHPAKMRAAGQTHGQ